MTPTDRRRPTSIVCAAVLWAVAAIPAPAVAEGPPGPAYIDCKCRANGRTYGLGERACVYTPGGPRIAECHMVQNVTSWAVQAGEGCVVSGLRLDGPRG